MKKNLIMKTLVVAGMMGLMLTGCGKGAPEKVTVEVEPTVEATTEVANPEEQPLIDEEPTVTPAEPTTEDTVEVVIEEEGTVVSDEQVEVGDYLSENGITITPQGTMTMPVAYYNSDETHDKTVEITVETVPSDEEGYVDTILTKKWDVATTGTNFLYGFDAYDRYTGYQLTLPNEEVTFLNEGGTYTDAVIIEVNGVQYDCSVTSTWDTSDASTWVGTFTIHHPKEYDGVVFRVGKQTATISAFEATLSQTTAHKLADYPELLDQQYFFTATDN